jgi:hypothetical protein
VREFLRAIGTGVGIVAGAVLIDAATSGRPILIPRWPPRRRLPRIATGRSRVAAVETGAGTAVHRKLNRPPILPDAADPRLIVRLW